MAASILIPALFLGAAQPASAGPLVLWRVPDRATESVDGADIALTDAREDVTERELDVVMQGSDLIEARAERRQARAERRQARQQVREAREGVRKASRAEQVDALLKSRADALSAALVDLDVAKESVDWHHDLVRAERSDLRLSKVLARQAKAELELAQARLLHEAEAGNAWLFDTDRFLTQAARIERAVDRQAVDTAIANSLALGDRSDLLTLRD